MLRKTNRLKFPRPRNSGIRSQRRVAFTLVEMVLVLAIVAVMVATLGSAITLVHTNYSVVKAEHLQQAAGRRIALSLRRDVHRCRGEISVTDNQRQATLNIDGVIVEYQIEEQGLTRSTHRDGKDFTNRWPLPTGSRLAIDGSEIEAAEEANPQARFKLSDDRTTLRLQFGKNEDVCDIIAQQILGGAE